MLLKQLMVLPATAEFLEHCRRAVNNSSQFEAGRQSSSVNSKYFPDAIVLPVLRAEAGPEFFGG